MDYYKPSEDFEVNNLQSLVDFDVTGSLANPVPFKSCNVNEYMFSNDLTGLAGVLWMLVVAVYSGFKRFVRLILRLEIGAFAGSYDWLTTKYSSS